MRRLIFITSSVILLVLLVIVSWFSFRFFYHPLHITEKSLIVTIPSNISTEELAYNLHERGILQDPYTFIMFTKWYLRLKHLKAGDYRLESGITSSQLLHKFFKGDVLLYKITFIEGWTFKQLMRAIQSNRHIIHTFAYPTPEAVMEKLGKGGENPEGMFFPDTYFFTSGTKDTQILRMAYNLMQVRLNHTWQNRDPKTPYHTAYEALIVASMVEKEASVAKDRPQIAGVILRRLDKQMPLQIDATVIYGLGDDYKGFLKRINLQTDTLYNTYTRRGLPPTPIAMPGLASIKAALHPAYGTALFYVAKGDGSHIFTDNLQAHHMAVAKYLLPLQAMMVQKKMQEAVELLRRMSISPNLLRNYWLFVGETT